MGEFTPPLIRDDCPGCSTGDTRHPLEFRDLWDAERRVAQRFYVCPRCGWSQHLYFPDRNETPEETHGAD